MKYFKDNKLLLFKYISIVILNVLIDIICSFYFKDNMYKGLILILAVVVVDLLVYIYKTKINFIWYLDIICDFLSGLLLMLFYKNNLLYGESIIAIYFANNIVFSRNRYSNKWYIRTLQYIIIPLVTLILVFINLSIFILIK